jgi:hypothetical protein
MQAAAAHKTAYKRSQIASSSIRREQYTERKIIKKKKKNLSEVLFGVA